jgi:hypothetical protein
VPAGNEKSRQRSGNQADNQPADKAHVSPHSMFDPSSRASSARRRRRKGHRPLVKIGQRGAAQVHPRIKKNNSKIGMRTPISQIIIHPIFRYGRSASNSSACRPRNNSVLCQGCNSNAIDAEWMPQGLPLEYDRSRRRSNSYRQRPKRLVGRLMAYLREVGSDHQRHAAQRQLDGRRRAPMI